MNMLKLGIALVTLGAATLTASAAEQALSVDKANSRVDIAVKATVDSFVAKLTDYAPSIQLNSELGTVTAAKISFHFADIRTGNEKRDHEMNVWQETDKFPDGNFTLGKLTMDSAHKVSAHGSLVLHGVTHELQFPVTLSRSGSGMTVDGEAELDTRWFGLPVIRKFGLLKVDPIVVVRFHLTGAIAAP